MLTVSDNHIVLGGGGGGGGGGGDVVGAASSTDNAVARFDGTTGKLVQNSGVTIDDIGSLTLGTNGYITSHNVWGMKWKFAGDAGTIEMNQAETAWKFNVDSGGVTKYRFNSSKVGGIGGAIVDFNVSGSSIFYGKVGVKTTSPTDDFDVNGSARFRGAIIDSTGSAGTNGQVLKNVNGLPVWSNP